VHERSHELQLGFCRICEVTDTGQPIPVLLPELRLEDWHLCQGCRGHLDRGFQRIAPKDAFAPYLNEHGVRFTERQLYSYITAGLHPDEAWQQHVGGNLHRLGVDLDAAQAANDRHDWPAVLAVVRMLQGRALVTRMTLERLLGPAKVEANVPPLVRAVQAVGLLISEGEIESLPPAELRVRMRAVLATLDYELAAFMRAPD
jgi:hypothetical protein